LSVADPERMAKGSSSDWKEMIKGSLKHQEQRMTWIYNFSQKIEGEGDYFTIMRSVKCQNPKTVQKV
jgi:hypothetical protein